MLQACIAFCLVLLILVLSDGLTLDKPIIPAVKDAKVSQHFVATFL